MDRIVLGSEETESRWSERVGEIRSRTRMTLAIIFDSNIRMVNDIEYFYLA